MSRPTDDWTKRWFEAGFRRSAKMRSPDGDWSRVHDDGSSRLTVQRLHNGFWRLMIHPPYASHAAAFTVRGARKVESFPTADKAWAATVSWMLTGELPDVWPTRERL